ncbi:Stk1 family PASTA domain-containing Ser/Thr kinase [Mycetocola tolaasinivorans]|uniref:non-specific serine/threonine protein kinase n=1 Tax=Mycetocola tolaasinivorans TaxID=76635 RepID=A0A3L7A783_9MICO|nr:Stk1 family PASTA domain-containing Ser/Thr kinase [Mycetocola tolaasinivorans]RLP75212.1 Stk1 family PASTA domain-containing Ser/Thr kinase [Mycetocola tolaasinivorans]
MGNLEILLAEEERRLADRYVVGALIGRGGMADVYQATDTKLGRTVALKILKADLASDPAFRLRFRQEAQAASRMAHPTIVRVYDAGEDQTIDADGHSVLQPFIVMEFVAGRTLRQVIADQGPLAPDRAVRIAAKILTALEYSHRAGVVHRDIKPGNIMLGADDTVKVMDFGIARAVSDTSATVAQTTAILGTASYFSPEQAKGETVDARTDLYSTGVVLFEMLTGRAPFRGETAVAVAYQHVSEAPMRPSQLNPGVSSPLDMVVLHALTKNREDRYQSATEFRDELEAAGQGRAPLARPEPESTTQLFGDLAAAPSGAEQALRQLTDASVQTKTQRRPPVVWIWAGAAVVAVILVAILVWVVSFSNTPLANPKVTVPALSSMTQENAVGTLRGLSLVDSVFEENSDTVAAGLVIRTDPDSGTEVQSGTVVKLYVSLGAKTVSVPTLSNMSQADATAKLTAAGLEVGTITTESSPQLSQGTVISSTPASGEAVAPGSRIDLSVSDGTVQVNDVTGNKLDVATAMLQALGLNVIPRPDSSCPAQAESIVNSQSLAPGSAPQGSDIQLGYCTGSTNNNPGNTPSAPPSDDPETPGH